MKLWLLSVLMLVACKDGPKPEPVGDGDQCVTCHVGIEPIHEPEHIAVDNCVICHGGDGEATTQAGAHVPIPSDWADIRGDSLPPAPDGYIKDMAPDQLDALDPAYVRFINPGDIRAAGDTCGRCHDPQMIQAVKNSIMTTNAGHYMPTRFLVGLQDRDAIYGSTAATDPEYDGAPGTVPSLTPLRPASDAELDAALAAGDHDAIEAMAFDHYLAKSCNTCHAAGYPRNNSPHLYRSTGCSSCHMVYNSDGVYSGDDEAMPDNVPVYPAKHQLTSAIPTEQCATCHFQGGRIGLLFRGIREGGFSEAPPNAEPWAESAYGHSAGYYFLDEDTTNSVDETPPDAHYAAGMHCADCHVGTDVHGDGRLYSTEKYQLDLKCEDCHGTPRQRVLPGADGLYTTSSGRRLPQLSTDDDGNVILTGIVDGAIHIVPQPADMLGDGSASAAMHAAMAPNDADWTHTDSVTCDTCHSSWQQFCVGCHVSYDMRFTQEDYQTGTASTGLVRGSRSTYSLDTLLLGTATDGRAQSCNPSAQVQMAVFDRDGTVQVGAEEVPDTAGDSTVTGKFRDTAHSRANIGFAPFFQHTTTAKARTCDHCHRADSTAEELARVRGVYGHGTGEFMLQSPSGGDPVDAIQFIDDDGNPLTEWVHEGTGPLSEEVRTRALSIILDEETR